MTKKNEKTTAKKIQKKREMDKETLENTMKIRIDRERLEDSESLDTSFLEGRVDAQSRKKVLNSKVSNKKHVDLTILRNIIVMVIFLVLLIQIKPNKYFFIFFHCNPVLFVELKSS